MGPQKAAKFFYQKNKKAHRFVVELYGALALTGKGHLTDWVIKKELSADRTTVRFRPEINYDYHPNGMKFFAFDNHNQIVDEWLVFSVGGGNLKNLDEARHKPNACYPHNKMQTILAYTDAKNIGLLEYIIEAEGEAVIASAETIVRTMFRSVERGLKATGLLPGPLMIKRRARPLFAQYKKNRDFNSLVFASALAVSEENAAGGEIVTAPTCGSSGVMAGVLYAYYYEKKYSFIALQEAVLIGGLIGNLVKHNASISGAEVGCQGEIGTACAMSAAAAAYLGGGTNRQIEYAAEIALEHHLGMTCDPVLGYVQIPCIERNALSARRAIDSSAYALLTDGTHYISLDDVILSLKETGKDLHPYYRETSLGGLAKRKIQSDIK